MRPELIIISLNFIIVSIGYLWIYPRLAGSSLKKVTANDLIASLTALSVAGSLFWDTGYEFTLIMTTVNWFWFTLLTLLLIEIPFMSWYLKRYNVFENY